MALALEKIHNGDCVKLMRRVEPATVDLVFADPPFNIGYDYDTYDDRQSYDAYLDWSRDWMSNVFRVLKSSGTFWLAIGDDYAAELKVLAQRDLGFTCRSWVIWYYTFGVNCKRKFSRSHTHLFHFVKDPKDFTFNAMDPAVRVPSARQLVYADSRANSKGRLPDDTWILRPQNAPTAFDPADDTWYYPRVAGTFKERAGFHGCQMPEQLLGRIIRVSSNPDDVVLDPFSGSGTSLVVAKKLGRRWIGTELSKDYKQRASRRLKNANAGDLLDGAENPLSSAPSTPKSRGARNGRPRTKQAAAAKAQKTTPDRNRNAVRAKTNTRAEPIVEAYNKACNGLSADCVLANPELNEAFADACSVLGVPGSLVEWNRSLLRLRKQGQLPRAQIRRQQHFSLRHMDSFSFASEIALKILDRDRQVSLDDILCDPKLVRAFDKLADKFAPGFSPFEYRWAALGVRKRAYSAKKAAAANKAKIRGIAFPRGYAIDSVKPDKFENQSGIYLFRTLRRKDLFIGETFDLANFLRKQLRNNDSSPWSELQTATVSVLPTESTGRTIGLRRAIQFSLIRKHEPELNSGCWADAQGVAL